MKLKELNAKIQKLITDGHAERDVVASIKGSSSPLDNVGTIVL